jgi:hypothetical protein
MTAPRLVLPLVVGMLALSAGSFASVIKESRTQIPAARDHGGQCGWGCAQAYGCATNDWYYCVANCCWDDPICQEEAANWAVASCW